jgi:hypothetical protein
LVDKGLRENTFDGIDVWLADRQGNSVTEPPRIGPPKSVSRLATSKFTVMPNNSGLELRGTSFGPPRYSRTFERVPSDIAGVLIAPASSWSRSFSQRVTSEAGTGLLRWYPWAISQDIALRRSQLI